MTMLYRAARRILVIPKGTDTEITYQPGDLVPDFASWDEVVRRAHLGQGNVVMDLPSDDPCARTCSVAEERTEDAATAKGDGEGAKKKEAKRAKQPDKQPDAA